MMTTSAHDRAQARSGSRAPALVRGRFVRTPPAFLGDVLLARPRCGRADPGAGRSAQAGATGRAFGRHQLVLRRDPPGCGRPWVGAPARREGSCSPAIGARRHGDARCAEASAVPERRRPGERLSRPAARRRWRRPRSRGPPGSRRRSARARASPPSARGRRRGSGRGAPGARRTWRWASARVHPAAVARSTELFSVARAGAAGEPRRASHRLVGGTPPGTGLSVAKRMSVAEARRAWGEVLRTAQRGSPSR